MSNINELVMIRLLEDRGYFNVEMFNTQYPAAQDNSGDQTHIKVRSEGDPVLGQGTDQSTFAKENEPQAGAKTGAPVLNFVAGKDPVYSMAQALVGNRMGQSEVKYHGQK